MNKTRTLAAAAVVLVAVVWLSCRSNHAPDVPGMPSGPACCFKDTTYTFKTVVTDPDDDSVSVRFDWGDSSDSHWMGWFASGDTVAFAHAWSDTGAYEVRASAQDRERVSDLSDKLKVKVVIRRPPETPDAPLGPGSGWVDTLYTFKAGSDHPDGMPLAIRFAWGDGDTSDWSDFVLPGGPVSMKHSWSAPDTYAVTAQAKDTGGVSSLWSSPHTTIIRAPDTMLKWRVQIAIRSGVYLYSSPAISLDGTVYVGGCDSSLYAVSPGGTVKWRFATGGDVASSPAVGSDGSVYVGSGDGNLYAVYPEGQLAWSHQTGGPVSSSPAIASDGTVYVGSDDHKLYAVNSDGNERWTFVTGGCANSSPAIAADGTVYFGSDDNYLYALNADGTLQWSFPTNGRITSSPAIAADGTIYVGSEDCFLYAVRPNGTLKWRFGTGGDANSSPAVAADGTIYLGSAYDPGYFYALDPDGTPHWGFPIYYVQTTPGAVSSDGTVYFGRTPCLYALRPDGTAKWRYWTAGFIESAPTIGTDGTVYFTSGDGYLYALEGTSPLADSPWPKFHHDLQNTGRTDRVERGFLRTVGAPVVTLDEAGFMIRIVNNGSAELTISSLQFLATPDTAFMRSFRVDSALGTGCPIPDGQPGIGPGDTVRFAPVTIAPYGAQLVELVFHPFYDREVYPPGNLFEVEGEQFVFRFDDGSVIAVNP